MAFNHELSHATTKQRGKLAININDKMCWTYLLADQQSLSHIGIRTEIILLLKKKKSEDLIKDENYTIVEVHSVNLEMM